CRDCAPTGAAPASLWSSRRSSGCRRRGGCRRERRSFRGPGTLVLRDGPSALLSMRFPTAGSVSEPEEGRGVCRPAYGSWIQAGRCAARDDDLAVLVHGFDLQVDDLLTAFLANIFDRRLGGQGVAGPDLIREADAELGEAAVADVVR